MGVMPDPKRAGWARPEIGEFSAEDFLLDDEESEEEEDADTDESE